MTFHITLYPVRSDQVLEVVKQGETLVINGEPYDFSVIPDGATLPTFIFDEAGAPVQTIDCDFLLASIERIDGVIHLTIKLPFPPDPPPEMAFPAPIINPPDGPLELPKKPAPPVEDEALLPAPEWENQVPEEEDPQNG